MSAKLTLNKFDLLYFLEGIVGGSHLRWDGYEKMVNDAFPQLNDDERAFIYTYSMRDLSGKILDRESEYWNRFIERYNPDNQYEITITDGVGLPHRVYKHKDKYYIDWNTRINEECIVEIKKLTIDNPYKRDCV